MNSYKFKQAFWGYWWYEIRDSQDVMDELGDNHFHVKNGIL
jgi:hypothetical protein